MSQSNDICSSCTSVFHFYTFVWNFWSARSCLISRIRNDLKQFLYEEVTFSLPLLCLRAFQSCNCHVVISKTTSKTRTKVRAARAASLVFLIKPLYYILNYGDVIAVMSTNFPRNNNSNCFWNAVNRPSFDFPASADSMTLKLRLSENSLWSFTFNLPDGSLTHSSSVSATSVGMSYSATVKNYSTEWTPIMINCSMPHCWNETICSTRK